jgi:alkaline phosphatase D
MLKKLSIFAISSFLLFCNVEVSFANTDLLQSGPMLGYSEMRESSIWVQTKQKAKVKASYYDKENPSKVYFTNEIETEEKNFFTAHLIANNVEPGKVYNYDIYINSEKINFPYKTEFKTPPLWQWRTNPTDFKVAVGSCFYVNEPEYDRPGKPYGSNYEIIDSIYKKSPDIMLWLGDNTYLREADWYSWTGIGKRYTHTRSLKNLQPLLASTHHYAIWDDHDFGNNDSDRSFRNKKDTLKAFKLFWSNPSYGHDKNKGVFTKFEWSDVEFFLLDNRYYKSPNNRLTSDKTLLGKEQINWLIDSLVNSKASFKIVAMGIQVLNPVVSDYIENYSKFQEEQKYLLETIKNEKIKGVVFLSGDRHQSELSKLDRQNNYPLYDFTVSPITAGAYDSSKENNFLRVPNTIYTKNNFGIIEFTGKSKDRKLTFTLFDVSGNSIWKKEIFQKELEQVN